MPVEAVINRETPSISRGPAAFAAEGLYDILLDLLFLPHYDGNLSSGRVLVNRIKNPMGEVDVAIVGKYVDYGDSYKSLNEALAHGGIANNVKVKLHYVDAETLENDHYPDVLFRADAILVPGGFGRRGVEGMMRAIRYAREKKVPFFGICLGLQTAVIEFARNVAGLEGANSTEFEEEPQQKVIYKLRDLIGVEALGGTMRLGKYPCDSPRARSPRTCLRGGARLGAAPPTATRSTRSFSTRLKEAGLSFTGMSPDKKFVEIIELHDDHRGSSAAIPPGAEIQAFRLSPALQGLIGRPRAPRGHREVAEAAERGVFGRGDS